MPSEHPKETGVTPTRDMAVIALTGALLVFACGRVGTTDNTQAASPAPETASSLPTEDASESVQMVENCVLKTPAGGYGGPCERVEWGGPSFLIRRFGDKAFVDGITEVVVEVDRPGEKANGSFRRGHEGDLVPAGPLTFHDDCACWARPDFRVGAFPYPVE